MNYSTEKEEESVKRKEKAEEKKKKRGDSSLFKDLLVLLPFVMIRSVPPRPRKTFLCPVVSSLQGKPSTFSTGTTDRQQTSIF